LLAYSDGIRAAILTGCSPDKNGYWVRFWFGPNSSPFKIFRGWQMIDRIEPFIMRRGLRFLFSKGVMGPIGRTLGYADLDAFNIPLQVASFFDTPRSNRVTTMRFPVASLPQILEINKLRLLELKTPEMGLGTIRRELAKIPPDCGTVLIDLHYLDSVAHFRGLDSAQYLYTLQWTDKLVRSLTSILSRSLRGRLVETLVFSDHGMVNSCRYLDTMKRIVCDHAFGSEYLVFLDSTMAHIWYLTQRGTKIAKGIFGSLPSGRFLDPEERKRMGIDFPDRRYGDDIYLLEPPYNFFPNFVSRLRPRAMHAYDPRHGHQMGVLIPVRGLNMASSSEASMVDIMPSVLRLLDLSIPNSCEGHSFV
jgi:hypothetical protein